MNAHTFTDKFRELRFPSTSISPDIPSAYSDQAPPPHRQSFLLRSPASPASASRTVADQKHMPDNVILMQSHPLAAIPLLRTRSSARAFPRRTRAAGPHRHSAPVATTQPFAAKSCTAPVVAETLTKRNAVPSIRTGVRFITSLPADDGDTGCPQYRLRIIDRPVKLIQRSAVYSILRPSFWTDTTRLPVINQGAPDAAPAVQRL